MWSTYHSDFYFIFWKIWVEGSGQSLRLKTQFSRFLIIKLIISFKIISGARVIVGDFLSCLYIRHRLSAISRSHKDIYFMLTCKINSWSAPTSFSISSWSHCQQNYNVWMKLKAPSAPLSIHWKLEVCCVRVKFFVRIFAGSDWP